MPKSESLRIHIDWWGKCRTCSCWHGDRLEMLTLAKGMCGNSRSPLFGALSTCEGYCPVWSTFDEAIAREIAEVEDSKEMNGYEKGEELERRRLKYEAQGE